MGVAIKVGLIPPFSWLLNDKAYITHKIRQLHDFRDRRDVIALQVQHLQIDQFAQSRIDAGEVVMGDVDPSETGEWLMDDGVQSG